MTVANNTAKCAQIAEVLKAIGHPIRIRIVAILCEGEQHVNGLAERLGVQQAIVSQQLQILRTRKLVAVTRDKGFSKYRIAEPQLHELVRCMESCNMS